MSAAVTGRKVINLAMAWILFAAVAAVGLVTQAVPPASAASSDVELAVLIDRLYDGVDPIPAIDDDPALPPTAGYTLAANQDHNGEVATLDIVGYRVTASVNLSPGSVSASEQVENLRLEMTLSGGATWSLPGGGPVAGCDSAGSYATYGQGTDTLICEVAGPLQTGDVFFVDGVAIVPGTMSDGDLIGISSSFTADHIPSGDTVAAAPASGPDTVVRTSTNDIDLRKGMVRDDAWEWVTDETGAATHVRLSWPIYIEPADMETSGGKGFTEFVQDTLTFTDDIDLLTPTSLRNVATLSGCGTRTDPVTSEFTNLAYYHILYDWTRSFDGPYVQDFYGAPAGLWTCTQAGGVGTDIVVSIAGADLSAQGFAAPGPSTFVSRPFFQLNAETIEVYGEPAGQNYIAILASGYINIDIPLGDVQAADLESDGVADNSTRICNTVAADLAASLSSAPVAGTVDTLDDNEACMEIDWTPNVSGDWSAFIGTYTTDSASGAQVTPLAGNPTVSTSPPRPSATEVTDSALAGQRAVIRSRVGTSSGDLTPTTGIGICQAFDTNVYSVVANTTPTGFNAANRITVLPWMAIEETTNRPATDPFDWATDATIQFASVPTWADFDAMTNMDSDGDDVVDCDDPDITFVDDPTTLPGGAASANLMRFQTQPGYILRPGTDLYTMIEIEISPTAPAGTIGMHATRFKRDQVTEAGVPGGWDFPCETDGEPCSYDPYDIASLPLDSPSAAGKPQSAQAFRSAYSDSNVDRLVIVDALARIRKSDVGPLASDYSNSTLYDSVVTMPAGDPWTTYQSVDLTAGPSGAVIENVTFVDSHPSNLILDSSSASLTAVIDDCEGTQNPDCITDPLARTNTGITTHVWNVGTVIVPANATMTVSMETIWITPLVANGTVIRNWVAVTGDGIPENPVKVRDSHSSADSTVGVDRDDDEVRLTVPPVFQLRKTVLDPLVPTDTDFDHQVAYGNPTTSSIASADIIDVLPVNGDVYNPATDYNGDFSLVSVGLADAPEVTNVYVTSASLVGSTTPASGTPIGDLDPQHPDHSGANAPGVAGGNWECLLADVGTGSCPALTAVTGLRFILGAIGSNTFGSIGLTFNGTSNLGDDIYTNRVGARAAGLALPVFSDMVSTEIFAASLGDLLYNDVDADGIFTPGTDEPISGVTIELFDAITGSSLGTTTTDADGRWVFTGLAEGSYYVEVPATEFASGGPLHLSTLTPAASSGDGLAANEDADHDSVGFVGGALQSETVVVTITEVSPGVWATNAPNADDPVDGTTNLDPAAQDAATYFTLDLALQQPSQIGDYVWLDENADGVQDAGEFGIPGVTVNLLNASGVVIATAVTDANGLYSFPTANGPGTYTVEIDGATLPTGAVQTYDLDGGGDSTATSAVPTDGLDIFDFGYDLDPSSISGTVFTDLLNDGSQTALDGDAPLEGITITLEGTDIFGNIVSVTATTDANGDYSFDNLWPGDYTVTETQPLSYGDGIDTPGTGGTTSTSIDDIIDVTLSWGESSVDNDFAEIPSSLAGTVEVDDGTPIEGVTLNLTGTDLDGNPVTATTTTEADGSYIFESLPAGTYTVSEVQPAAYVDGTDVAGSEGGTAVNPGDEINTIALPVGTDATDYDFVEVLPASIAGTVTDENGDPIVGVMLTLTGTDDLGDPVSVVVTTDANGDYLFDGLRPGTYTVTETQPVGFGEGGESSPDPDATVTLNTIADLVLTSGEANIDNDFVETYSSLSGTVFVDVGLDGGAHDAVADLPIAGVTVTLSGTDAAGNTVTATAVTDADGNYTFTDLLAGDYVVTETQPAGYDDGTDVAGSAGGTAVNPGDEINAIALPAGTDAVDYDFGEIPVGSIAGTVTDENGDPIEGVTITLTGVDSLGNPVASVVVTTDANGDYIFENLPPGTYTVTETQPSGFGEGAVAVGSEGGTVAPDAVTGIVLGDGTVAVDYDFVETYASLAGTVYYDANENGVQDLGEIGIPIVDVTLTGTDAAGNAVNITVQTDTSGGYIFTGLLAGDYTVTEAQPATYLDGTDVAGSEGGTAVNPGDEINTIALPVGVDAVDYDFAEVQAASIAGTVTDENGDPIEGVTLTLTGVDDLGDPVSVVVTTDANGDYLFDGLRPGTYTVTETQPVGFGEGGESSPDPDATVTLNTIADLVLTSGEANIDNDFVETYSSLAGTVLHDANEDGVEDLSDAGIEGVTVELNGTDAAGNPVSLTTTTDADGNYSFDDLLAGDYVVTEIQPADYLDGVDTAGSVGGTAVNPGDEINTITLPAGTDAVDYDFGEVLPSSIAGTVLDENGDPIVGVTLALTGTDDLGNPVTLTVTTDTNGDYLFADIRPGTYTVTETQPAGFGEGGESSPDPDATVTLNTIADLVITNGENNIGNDFVETYSSLTGTVFLDVDGDGVQDLADAGIEGVTVELNGTDAAGNPVSLTTTTDADGNYSFDDLLAGDYVVTEIQPADYLDGVDTAGSVGGTAVNPGDEINTITLPAGTNADSYDFAEIQAGSIAGTVLDGNGDPIEGVTLTLTGTDHLGNPVTATVTTDADGQYVFDGLLPGTYTVTETQPIGHDEGGESTEDPAATTSTNVIAEIELGSAEASVNNDFAETYASLSGTVFADLNEDGVLDPLDEAGIEGVTVELNGTDAAGNPVSLTTTTDADGNYSFDDLLAGDYVVTEIQPADYLDGVDTAGSVGGTAVNPGDEINTIILPAGADAVDYDFGEVQSSSIAGTVLDANGGPIAGVTLTLTGTDDLGNPVTLTVTTDANGDYLFANIRPGTYTVTETQPAGYGEGGETSPDPDSAVSTNVIADLVISSGEANVGNDFVETYSSLSGTVFHDLDDDAAQGSTELGIPGVEIQLTGTDAAGNPVSSTTTTDADGNYTFTDILAGDYVVTEVHPVAFVDGNDTAGSEGGAAANPGDEISAISLPVGTDAVDYDFSEQGTVLTGVVWVDPNGDGVLDAGEDTFLEGIEITLLDADGNVVGTTTTDGNGSYSFEGLVAGDYTVVQNHPDGYGSTTPSVVPVTIVANELTVANFGEGLGSIGDAIWQDLNGDGVQDSSEPGVGDVTLNLLDADGNVVATTVTDADGNYQFTGLPIGDYQVEIVPPEGMNLVPGDSGGDDTLDSDADWLTGLSPVVSIGVHNCTDSAALVSSGHLRALAFADGSDACPLVSIEHLDFGLATTQIDLALSGSVDATTVDVGDVVTYTFSPTNTSNVPLEDGVEILVELPDGLSLEAVNAPGWNVTIVDGTAILVWPGPLLPGQALPEFTVDAKVETAGVSLAVDSTIKALGSGVEELSLSNNAETLTITSSDTVGPTGPLAFTGASSGRLASGAALMIAAGGALVLGSRRRKRPLSA